jgi:hypothetical protein
MMRAYAESPPREGRGVSKGWMVEVTGFDKRAMRPRMTRLLFDVAIEDRAKAVDAVRHHTTLEAATIVAVPELRDFYGLSPGRIKPR